MSGRASLTHGIEAHPRRSFLSDFILGSQDGLVNILGILLGVAAASTNLRIILVATLAALGAESISMGAVAYTSTAARRRFYQGEEQRELVEMREVPEIERSEVREVLTNWGYAGEKLDQLLAMICENPKAMLEFMMAFELRLQPVDADEPSKSGLTVLAATMVGSLVPLVPFLFLYQEIRLAVLASALVSGIVLFLIGWYEARTTNSSVWRSGLTMLAIGLSAGFAGFLIGHFLGASGAL
ncbi:MAG TPA: VIT1/CCC1 transporter family protein [Thermoplasmata archaeon]|nr:VIT1/CCC1 transporter family protein [Thermoplasmata archaeon]